MKVAHLLILAIAFARGLAYAQMVSPCAGLD